MVESLFWIFESMFYFVPILLSGLWEGSKALSEILGRIFYSSSLLFLGLFLVLLGMVRTLFSGRIDGWGRIPFVLILHICIIVPRPKIVLSQIFWWDMIILCFSLSGFVVTWPIGKWQKWPLFFPYSRSALLERRGEMLVFGILILVRGFLVNLCFVCCWILLP